MKPRSLETVLEELGWIDGSKALTELRRVIGEIENKIEELETRISKGIAYDFDKEKLNWTGQIIGMKRDLALLKKEVG